MYIRVGTLTMFLGYMCKHIIICMRTIIFMIFLSWSKQDKILYCAPANVLPTFDMTRG